MTTLGRKLQRRSRFLDDARDVVAHPIEAAKRRPYLSTGGVLALLLAGFVTVSVFPEVHRYLHVKRM